MENDMPKATAYGSSIMDERYDVKVDVYRSG